MNVTIAPDKASVARLLSDYARCTVKPEDIEITENPDGAGNLRIGWHFDHFKQHFVVSPRGEVAAEELYTLE